MWSTIERHDARHWRSGQRSARMRPWARRPFRSRQAAHRALARGSSCRIRLEFLQAILCFAHHQPQGNRRRLQSHLSGPSPHKTPPTKPFTFSFSSLIPTFYRPAASTVCTFYSSSSFYTPCARKLCISPTPVRSYASAKKKKMPPKKVVKEEKILLGRPGNSLTSGIVSESPAPHCRRVLTLTVVARSA
jgi:hypothetical protein